MSPIAEAGNRILAALRELGLPNGDNLQPGLSLEAFNSIPQFSSLGRGSELEQLFTWRNGTTTSRTIPMRDLWIVPGFYLLPAGDSVTLSRYCYENFVPKWPRSWYPLSSSGSADCHFVDIDKAWQGCMPVLYYDPEIEPTVAQIYDSIERMFWTILACYQEGALFLDSERCLAEDVEARAGIARKYNPNSGYWRLDNLY